MSFVIAVPEFLGAAATDLAGIGTTLSAANAAAAVPTTGIMAAAQDEVSAAVAALFSGHGQGYQALSAGGLEGVARQLRRRSRRAAVNHYRLAWGTLPKASRRRISSGTWL